jgi:hypothetical protein
MPPLDLVRGWYNNRIDGRVSSSPLHSALADGGLMPPDIWTTCIQLGPGFVALAVLVWHTDRLLRRHDREMAKERVMFLQATCYWSTLYEVFFVDIARRFGMSKSEVTALRGELERRREELLSAFPKRDSDAVDTPKD